MNALLRSTLNNLKTKVEKLVLDNRALKNEAKQLSADKAKLEAALKKAQAALESEKNKKVSEAISATDKKKLVKQIDKYIKLIDTSMAQIKSK